MPLAKRRKVTVTNARSAASQGGITAFTRISKAQVLPQTLLEKNGFADKPVTKELNEEGDIEKRKRKADVADIGIDEQADDEASAILFSALQPSQRNIRPLPRRKSIALQRPYNTPDKPLVYSSPIETPSKRAADLFEKVTISSSSPLQIPSSPVYSSQATKSTLFKSSQNQSDDDHLPSELQDLINLHSAFLTALSLHYAHNGTNTPADLRMLCPDVARAWGKRKVTLEDIRKIMAVLNGSIPAEIVLSATEDRTCAELSLSDYGHGKICIEIKTGSGRSGKIARPLDENFMNAQFVANIHALWSEAQSKSQQPAELVNNFALEPIRVCSSLSKMSPLLAKGQKRLEDLRAGIQARKEAAAEAKSSMMNADVNAETGKKMTLLERLQAKQRAALNAPLPPTKADLSRTAGLHRLEEVAAVLTLLTTSSSVGQSRVSFTMPTVLGKLKDSFKTPMSREEGDVCLRLLAQEIAPEWFKIVKMKKSESVVVNREARPSDDMLREKVKSALNQ